MRTLLIYIALLVMAAPAWAGDITLTAKAVPDRLPPGQVFRFVIEVKGAGVKSLPAAELSRLTNFEIVGKSTSQSIRMINMSVSVTKTTTYQIVAPKEGVFTIAPVTVTYDGVTYKTDPVTITVDPTAPVPSGPRTARRRGLSGIPGFGNLFNHKQGQGRSRQWSEDDFKVTMEVDKTQVVPFETLIATFSFYRAVDLWEQPRYEKPTFNGFWVEDAMFPDGKQERESIERIDGRLYHVTQVRYALAALAPGESFIGVSSITFLVDPWSNRQRLYTKPVLIEVKPFPEKGKPDSFANMVGNYHMSAVVEPVNLSVNESVKLIITIEGDGYIKNSPIPTKIAAPGFDLYDPKITDSIDKTGGTIRSIRVIEYPLIAKVEGENLIPSYEFSWYDPDRKKYITEHSKQFKISVSPDTRKSGQNSRGKVARLKDDIRYIKPDTGKLVDYRRPYYQKPFAWIVLFAPFPLWFAGWVSARRKRRLMTDRAYARRISAGKMFIKRLEPVTGASHGSRGFYAGLDHAVRGYLGDVWNVPSASIDVDLVREKLGESGDCLAEDIIALFGAVERARYAQVSSEDRTRDLAMARKIVEKMERMG